MCTTRFIIYSSFSFVCVDIKIIQACILFAASLYFKNNNKCEQHEVKFYFVFFLFNQCLLKDVYFQID